MFLDNYHKINTTGALGTASTTTLYPDNHPDNRLSPEVHNIAPSDNQTSSQSFLMTSTSPSGPTSPRARRSRASRACENCRKRKVKCSEGDVCNECRRFGEKCYYREHYRAKREFSVKILQSPDFTKKDRSLNDEKLKQRSDSISIIPPASLSNNVITTASIPNNVTTTIAPSNNPSHSTTSTSFMINTPGRRHSTDVLDLTDKITLFTENFLNNRSAIQSFLRSASASLNSSSSPSNSVTSSSNSIDKHHHLTEEQMLQTLTCYFQYIHRTGPFLKQEIWSKLAKSVWRATEYGTPLPCSEVDLAIIYMIVALGCIANNPFRAQFAGISSYHWALEYYSRANTIVPDVFEVTSLKISQYMMLVCQFKYLIGQYRSAYLYGGALSKTIRALGLHKVDLRNDNSPEAYEKHRTLFCAVMMERYTSLRVGRPSFFTSANGLTTELFPEAFNVLSTDNWIATTLMILQNGMLWTCSSTMSEIYNSSSLKDIVLAYDKIINATKEFQLLLSNADEPFMRSEDVEVISSLSHVQIRQWILIRLISWSLTSTMCRPFLLLLGALQEPSAVSIIDDLNLPDVLTAIRSGAEMCIRAQFKITSLLSHNLVSKIGDTRSCWFIKRHVLSAVQILLFYKLCAFDSTQGDEWLGISEALQNAINFLNQIPDINNGSAISLLTGLLDQDGKALTRDMPHIRRQFAKIFFLVLDGEDEDLPSNNDEKSAYYHPLVSEKDVLAYWHKALEALG